MVGPQATAAAFTTEGKRGRPRAKSTPPRASAEGTGEGLFSLPAGYLGEDGTLHTEAQLALLTGRDEEFLTSMPEDICLSTAVTALLGRCLKRVGTIEHVDEELARDLLVCDRNYLVLKLREMTFGARVDAVLRCLACARPMDVTFSLDDIEVESRPLPARFFRAELSPAAAFRDGEGIEHREVEFRLPTGADQEAAACVYHEDEGEHSAHELILARLVRRVGGGEEFEESEESDVSFAALLNDAARSEVESRMSQVSPAAEIELDGECPECREQFETSFDLTAFFAAEMQNNLRSLERAVHLLAFHYHWSEGEILSLTRRKRQRYIELVEEELAR
jgi:hypothetical protein